MNIFQRMFKPKSEKRNNIPTGSNQLVNGCFNTDIFSFNSTNSLNNASVLRGISAISSAVASMKAFEYQLVHEEKIPTNGNIDILLNIAPNQFTTAYQLKKQLVENAFYYGNSLIKIQRDLNNNILSLELLNSQLLTAQYNQQENQCKYHYAGKEIDITTDYILFFIYPDKQYNGMFGMSLANYAKNTLRTSNYITQHQDNYFNGGSVTGILTTRNHTGQRATTPEAAKQAKETFINSSIGSSLIWLDGDLEYQKVNVNARDSMLLELNQFSVIELARILNIPTSYLFDTASISEDDRITFYSETLQPILENLENQFVTKFYFKKDWNKKLIEFDYESLMKTNKATQAEYYTKLFNLGAVSPNDICKKLNLKTSSEPNANERFVLQNAQPLSLNLNEVKAAEAGLIKTNNENENE